MRIINPRREWRHYNKMTEHMLLYVTSCMHHWLLNITAEFNLWHYLFCSKIKYCLMFIEIYFIYEWVNS
jgi:hypothetical protein